MPQRSSDGFDAGGGDITNVGSINATPVASIPVVTSSAPADVTKAAATAGVSTEAARADHKHDVTTAAASSTGTANAEGSATSLSRSDHVHRTQVAVQDEGIAIASRPTLNFIGTGVSAADDAGNDRINVTISGGGGGPLDVHENGSPVVAAASVMNFQSGLVATTPGGSTANVNADYGSPVNVGSANSDGVATSLSRSDHVHAIPFSVLSTLLQHQLVEATADTSTTSATDVAVPGMAVTPAVAGTYDVGFYGSMECSNAGGVMFTSIYLNGVQVAASEREIDAPGSSESSAFCCAAKVTVTGVEVIDGRWRTSTGTATMHERQLRIFRVG